MKTNYKDAVGRPGEVFAQDKKTNATATATMAARSSFRHTVVSFCISASGSPASAVEATLSDGTTTFRFQLPAAAFGPFVWNVPLPPFADGAAVSLVVPALGVGVTCAITLLGYTRKSQ